MKLESAIKEIDKDVILQEKIIQQLKQKKEIYLKIKEEYPDAVIDRGNVCLNNIWDKITCMRIERNNYYDVSVKFLVGKKFTICGMNTYTNPLFSRIATIQNNYSGQRRTEITIFDFKSLIPDSCPSKKKFVKRIKIYLLNRIVKDKLFIHPNSFGKEEFTKLMLLK